MTKKAGKKKSLVGWVKEDWIEYFNFYTPPKSYATCFSRQHRKQLRWVNIFNKDDVYYDKRNRHPKIKVRITIEEIN